MALRILSCLGGHNRVSQTGCSSTTEVYYLTVLKVRGPKSKCEQGWVHLRARRQDVLWVSSQLTESVLVSVCICSLCLPWVPMSSFYKDTSHNKLGYTLMTSSSQIISLTTLLPSTIAFPRHHGLWMLGVHNATHNDLTQWEASMWERGQGPQFSLSSPTLVPWNWECLHHSRLLCKISDLHQIQINSKMLLSILKCLYVWNRNHPGSFWMLQ